jgi:3-phenylpropionate/trans-cinnamate dioxygenase ferredoxin reductase subunit
VTRNVRIVGAGQAGLQVALSLRDRGYGGEVTLIGGEPHLPYHRPPLSKRGLAEAIGPEALAIRSREAIERQGICLCLGNPAESIDRTQRHVRFADGTTLAYDTLVLATGSRPRRLSLPGADRSNVAMLKDYADLQRLRGLLDGTRHAVLIGGGFVGLELASSLTQRGISVVILEAGPRILGRVASADLSAHIEATHRARGVDIRTGAAVATLMHARGATTVVLASGENIDTDLVLVGIGADADDRLAATAGLRTDRGILVDGEGRTSDAAIYAAGDCTRFDHPFYGSNLRIESVNNALEQGRWVAANIMGQGAGLNAVPWFWSDQFDVKIQLAGLPSRFDQLEVVPTDVGFVRHYVRGGVLRAVEAVNAPRAFMQARRRIEAELTSMRALEGAA